MIGTIRKYSICFINGYHHDEMFVVYELNKGQKKI